MANISERLTVRCPYQDASRYLAAFLAEHAHRDGAVSVPLRLPIKMFTDRQALLERRIIATLYPLCSSADPHPTYSVSVTPKSGRPFPHFAGALAVERSTADERFGLLVSGHYEPPLGTVGKFFDIALGRRFAQAMAGSLLRTIADSIEYANARNEAAHAGHTARSGHMTTWDSHAGEDAIRTAAPATTSRR